MPDWIEQELSRGLGPVEAPATLWGRIHSARPQHPKRRDFRWVLWPAFAGMVLLASSGIRYHAERPTVTRQDFPQATFVRAITATQEGRGVCITCHTDRL